MLLSKGVSSVDRDQINSWDLIEQIMAAKEAIPESVAKAWLGAQSRGLLPTWAEKQINIDVLRKAAL